MGHHWRKSIVDCADAARGRHAGYDYTAPNPAPYLGNTSIQPGAYTAVTLTVSGNPGDVLLTTSADAEPGFAAAPSTTIPTGQVQILGTSGSPGSLTVPVNLTLDSPLVVNSNENTALDLEFDLSHPAFIVAHVPPGNGTTLWAVNFNGAIRRRHIHDVSSGTANGSDPQSGAAITGFKWWNLTFPTSSIAAQAPSATSNRPPKAP